MPLLTCRPLALAVIVSLLGCANEPTVPPSTRAFTLVGTLGVPRWNSDEVPGSTETRPGTTLPAFLVCETADGNTLTRAAAVIDRGVLTLHGDGTARLDLTSGTWWSTGGSSGASGGSISEFGRWTEENRGTIQLTGFTTARFDAPLQYTEMGAAQTVMTFECPGASAVPSLRPELVFSLTK